MARTTKLMKVWKSLDNSEEIEIWDVSEDENHVFYNIRRINAYGWVTSSYEGLERAEEAFAYYIDLITKEYGKDGEITFNKFEEENKMTFKEYYEFVASNVNTNKLSKVQIKEIARDCWDKGLSEIEASDVARKEEDAITEETKRIERMIRTTQHGKTVRKMIQDFQEQGFTFIKCRDARLGVQVRDYREVK